MFAETHPSPVDVGANRARIHPWSDSATSRILVVDDDAMTVGIVGRTLERAGYLMTTARDGEQALKVMQDDIRVVLLDLKMPMMNGLDCLRRLKQRHPHAHIIMMSAQDSAVDIVSAVRAGASEFLIKPLCSEELILKVQEAFHRFEYASEVAGSRANPSGALLKLDFAQNDAASQRFHDRVRRIAKLESTVLMTGESGTGKSTIARMIHQQGSRAHGPFIVVNCASLPRDLIESELFGHKKGAFTGAISDRPGRAEIADGGTLFLDEVGDLPLDLQPKLLTFLQDRVVQRIGCNEIRQVDVRVVAATHQDLVELCQAGRFREDLYYRLNVLSLRAIPLRERLSQLEELCEYILHRISRQRRVPEFRLTRDAYRLLMEYDWPGNIRELENTLERATAFCESNQIQPEDIEFGASLRRRRTDFEVPRPALAGRTLLEIEKQAIEETLAANGGNKAQSARDLGISEKSIYNKLRRHGLID